MLTRVGLILHPLSSRYGKIPDTNGEPASSPDVNNGTSVTEINTVQVGAKGSEIDITLDDITLMGKYTFSCNPVTDDVASFTDNYGAGCMDVCHETVKTLRSLPVMMVLEENDTYTPFYTAMGVIVPLFFLCCCITSLGSIEDGGEDEWRQQKLAIMDAFVLTCKLFDWMSDWAYVLK